MSVSQPGAGMGTVGVDLVDEDDAGRVARGLFEHVAHARGADADEHLDEIGPRNGEEGNPRLAGDGAGEQGLAGAGRTDEQRALRNLAAEHRNFGRVRSEARRAGKECVSTVSSRWPPYHLSKKE